MDEASEIPNEQISATAIEELLASKRIPEVEFSEEESRTLARFGKQLADAYFRAELKRLGKTVIEPRVAAIKAMRSRDKGERRVESPDDQTAGIGRRPEGVSDAVASLTEAPQRVDWTVIPVGPPYEVYPTQPEYVCRADTFNSAMGGAVANSNGTMGLGVGVGWFAFADSHVYDACDTAAGLLPNGFQGTACFAGIRVSQNFPRPLPADGLVTAYVRIRVGSRSSGPVSYDFSPGSADSPSGGLVGASGWFHMGLFTVGVPTVETSHESQGGPISRPAPQYHTGLSSSPLLRLHVTNCASTEGHALHRTLP